MKTNIRIIVFAVYALVLLIFCLAPIRQNNDIIEKGKMYQFKTEPIDPVDLFRGRYITLNYDPEQLQFQVTNEIFKFDETCYVSFQQDENGFTKIKNISKTEPKDDFYYTTTTKFNYDSEGNKMLSIEFPFTRYYMEENKAPIVENAIRSRDTLQKVYSEIYFYKGQGILKDVFINGIPVEQFAEEN